MKTYILVAVITAFLVVLGYTLYSYAVSYVFAGL